MSTSTHIRILLACALAVFATEAMARPWSEEKQAAARRDSVLAEWNPAVAPEDGFWRAVSIDAEFLRSRQEPFRSERGEAWDSIADSISALVLSNPFQYVVDFRDGSRRVEIPAYPALDFSSAFSYSLWLRCEGNSRVPQAKIVSQAGVSDGKITVMLSALRIQIMLRFSDGTSAVWEDADDLPEHRWVHVGVVYDEVAGLALYLEGLPRTLGPGSVAGRGSLRSLPDQPIYVGCLDRCFPGRIDEFRAYDRRLSPGEITDLADGREIPRGLVGFWNFDEDDGDSAPNAVRPDDPALVGHAVGRETAGFRGGATRSLDFSGRRDKWSQELGDLESSRRLLESSGVWPGPIRETLPGVLRYRLQKNGARLLLFMVSPNQDRAWAYTAMATDDSLTIHEVDLGTASRLIGMSRELDEALALPPTAESAQETHVRLRELGQTLLDPIVAHWTRLGRPITAQEQLWIRPDPRLSRIPYSALVRADGRPWIAFLPVAICAPMAIWNDSVDTTRELQPMVAFGDPAFGVRSDRDPIPPWGRTRDPGRPTGRAGECLEPSPWLIGSHLEVEFIRQRCEEAQIEAHTYAWQSATEAAFDLAAPRARILHLATHRYELSETCLPRLPESPLDRIGLELAGSGSIWADHESPKASEDGYLSAAELSRVDLSRSSALILSGCSTWRGPPAADGSEWSLVEAATLAGARASVASLWDVGDRETYEFMIALHTALLDGAGIPEAVREAKLDALQRCHSRFGFVHPAHWAAFELAGFIP